jgi:type III restriction enzyme
MLKEGWDVKNVTTIVGLRPYAADSKILPEQTLGRGLRRMYFGRDDIEEYVSVVGTPAFMEFVESINGEGVILEHKAMGTGSAPITPTVIEVDRDNPKKDIEKLDIEIPVMSPRIQREYKNLAELDVSKLGNEKVAVKVFSEQEKREIVFKDVVGEKTHHTTILTGEIKASSDSLRRL